MKQTTWCVFLLANLMDPLLVFSAVRTSELLTTGKINYTTNLFNMGNKWNSRTNVFTAPRNGSYVFGLSNGVISSVNYNTYVLVNGITSFKLPMVDNTHNGIDIASRIFAISLAVSDTLCVYLSQGNLFSDSAYRTLVCRIFV